MFFTVGGVGVGGEERGKSGAKGEGGRLGKKGERGRDLFFQSWLAFLSFFYFYFAEQIWICGVSSKGFGPTNLKTKFLKG